MMIHGQYQRARVRRGHAFIDRSTDRCEEEKKVPREKVLQVKCQNNRVIIESRKVHDLSYSRHGHACFLSQISGMLDPRSNVHT